MTIIEIIFPVFAIAAVGYVVAYKQFFTPEQINGISRFVFALAIPVLLFDSLATITLPETIEWRFLVAYYGVALFIYGVGLAVGRVRFDHTMPQRGVFAMGAAYSNMVLIGLPIVLSAFGDAATLPMTLLISVHSAIMFFLVSAVAEMGGGGSTSAAIARRALVNIVTNPIIVGLLLGLLFNLAAIPIPTPLGRTIALIGRASLPCALFVLGASLSRFRLAGYFSEALTIVSLKMLLQPLLVWVLAFYVFQLDPLWGAVAVVVAGLPTGINAYLFAEKYQACIAPMATAILVSTALATGTLSLWLAILL